MDSLKVLHAHHAERVRNEFSRWWTWSLRPPTPPQSSSRSSSSSSSSLSPLKRDKFCQSHFAADKTRQNIINKVIRALIAWLRSNRGPTRRPTHRGSWQWKLADASAARAARESALALASRWPSGRPAGRQAAFCVRNLLAAAAAQESSRCRAVCSAETTVPVALPAGKAYERGTLLNMAMCNLCECAPPLLLALSAGTSKSRGGQSAAEAASGSER